MIPNKELRTKTNRFSEFIERIIKMFNVHPMVANNSEDVMDEEDGLGSERSFLAKEMRLSDFKEIAVDDTHHTHILD